MRSCALTNHPIGGPLFSGPAGPAVEVPARRARRSVRRAAAIQLRIPVEQPAGPAPDQPYDPAHPPSDVATTTTDGGVTVPFIVRIETGYEDRDQYKIATLFQPDKPWTWSAPQAQWNHKLLITHGASCNVDYAAGNAPSVTSYDPADDLGLPVSLNAAGFGDSAQYALAHGFAVMSTALDNNGHNCNLVTQAESLVMAKEHVITTLGTLRYTIGAGCSGGSLAQQWIANAYPGIYQGILPTCSFPDTWSSATQVMDYHLLRAYFENSSHWGPGIVWLADAVRPRRGQPAPARRDHQRHRLLRRDRAHPRLRRRQRGAALPAADEPRRGPLLDRRRRDQRLRSPAARRLVGQRAPSRARLRRGAGRQRRRPVRARRRCSDGQITPAQFVDLNQRIGGLDIDINPTAARISATMPALARAYRSGMINEANNLDQTAIIDCRGPDPGAAHDSYRAFAVRARLDREHGGHANQLIWEGPAPIIGDTNCTVTSLVAMDRWLGAVEHDPRPLPVAGKIVLDKPARPQRRVLGRHRPEALRRPLPERDRPGLRNPPDRRRRRDHHRRQQVPAEAAAPRRLLRLVHRRRMVGRSSTPSPAASVTTPSPASSRRPTIPWLSLRRRSRAGRSTAAGRLDAGPAVAGGEAMTRSVSLPGACAAVTGGGRGIGRAIALALAAAGARVAVGDLDAAPPRHWRGRSAAIAPRAVGSTSPTGGRSPRSSTPPSSALALST